MLSARLLYMVNAANYLSLPCYHRVFIMMLDLKLKQLSYMVVCLAFSTLNEYDKGG
jgi:hypothetical protein